MRRNVIGMMIILAAFSVSSDVMAQRTSVPSSGIAKPHAMASKGIEVRATGFRRDLSTGEFVQLVTISNLGRESFTGRLKLLVSQRAVGAGRQNAGAERRAYPADREDSVFGPGASETIQVRFAALPESLGTLEYSVSFD